MDARSFTPLDRLVGEIDRAIKVLAAPARSNRMTPGEDTPDELSPAERAHSARLMRINHAGEIAAQALYQGQSLTAKDATVRAAMQQAAHEETDHLAWCEQRIAELGGRTSLLNPLWYLGSLAIGTLAGALGDKVSLGFVSETEAQVESHLGEHLERLNIKDIRSRKILAEMRNDEVRHGQAALSLGGEVLPRAASRAMRLVSKLMTRSAYWV
jgi:3-demethoxyubiquinol 3-hydroxylase